MENNELINPECTTLVKLTGMNYVELFTVTGVEELIQRIEVAARSLVIDASTEEGRDRIKAHAYKVAKAKTFLDAEGKDLTEDWREKTKQVNAERKKIVERLDALKAEVRRPVTEYEAEQERIEADRLAEIARVAEEARLAEESRVAALEAENERLREAERLRVAAEQKRVEEQERAERDKRLQAEAAEQTRVFEQNKAAQQIADAKAAQEKAERDAAEAAERAEREKQEAVEAERRRAKADADRKELERLAAERKEKEEAERKAANQRHRNKVHTEAIMDFVSCGVSKETAIAVVKCISEGKVVHIAIQY
jgi:hypothetical protein